ncbi:MAG: ORF6N domain-containing protein, partial [Bacilli bacterium]
MNEIIVKDVKIENMIYEVRGKQVMLDSDLAKLYECKNGTKDINKAAKRNIARFPEDFYFQLTKTEVQNLRFQNGTSSHNKENYHGGNRYLPYVFTEQGIAMLSSVLKTPVAEKVSINIMRAFIAMRKYISSNLLEQKYVNNMVFELDERVSLLENTFSKFDTFSNEIFFEGQIYDSYSLLLDIFSTSNNSIVIIDNYISKSLLDVLSKTNKKITIYTKNIDNNLINKYNGQYHNVKVLINNSFHDRFIIIDNKVLY